MATKSPARELTADELKTINRQINLAIALNIGKRLLIIPLVLMAFIVLTVLGLATTQLTHALSGAHNIREQH